MYIRHPGAYRLLSWFLVFVLFGLASFFTEFSLWLRVVLFIVVILIAEMEGKIKATHKYRRNIQEMLEEDDLDDETKNNILRDLKKSGSELLKERRRHMRILSGKF